MIWSNTSIFRDDEQAKQSSKQVLAAEDGGGTFL
jgi:hypothetical protein